ncbi:MAG: aldose 1-epimerase family protein [Actinobacteria bacterium]|nr:aldose 1-epimerase family protein [Actinomycetota bacterium]MBU4314371.1 aldose 1-epimerase family protein [Actinomycetota bacterium]MBU4482555.1 aldose 1-epimerase family protein [Actinomycetota bacterium]MDP3011635.1 aldose 1-epimerase family protein [Candidatus Hydromicrobium sp.]
MKIFGTEIGKDEILKRVGDIDQLGGIRYYEFIDGVRRGVRAIDIKSPCGLDMTILPDRGMDISNLSYKSIPISWKSVTRETSPVYYESRGIEWLRTFYGGLITTCGLTNIGIPCVDNGEELGLHGRIANISAENVLANGRWENDSYIMWVQGKVREARVFGHKLQLERKITTWMDIPRIVVEDTVENIGYERSPFMILYHVNIGYPVIDNGARLLEGEAKVISRDNEAKDGEEDFDKFHEPLEGYKEKVYFHDIKADEDGNSNIAIVNEDFDVGQGIGIWLKFNKDNLPFLIQWKQMGMGEYVCGIEPGNSLTCGRKVERKHGRLKFIEPGEKVNFRLEFNILKSNKDVDEFKDRFCK